MAKKAVIVEEDENGNARPKKKRSKCCTCCIVFLIVSVVLMGIGCGVGWYFGDKYTQQYLDMPLSDVLSLVGELYWTDDEDVVTRPYKKSDLDGFYSQLKTNILLKDDVDVDFDAELKDVIKQFMSESDAKSSPRRNEDSGGGDSGGESGAVDSSFMDIFVGLAEKVFTRENIDVQKLNAYSEENDNYIFQLNDKQLAAFLNSVLQVVLKDGMLDIPGAEEITSAVNLSKVIALKQVRFGTVKAKDEYGLDKVAATTADVTIWIGVEDMAGAYLSNLVRQNGVEWASGLVEFLADCILPKNLYATLTIPLSGEADTHITINDMDSGKRDMTYKLINGILGISGGDMTVQSLLSSITDQIKPFIEAASDQMKMDSASTGTIEFDLLGALAAMTGEDEDSALTKPEFMYMLQALLGSDPDVRLEQIKPHLFDSWYTDGTNEVYNPSSTDGLTKIDYTQSLIEEMERKYALDLPTDENGDKSLNDILQLLGITFDDGSAGRNPDSIIDMLNTERFHDLLDDDIENLKVNITDRMLGTILSSEMNRLLGDTTDVQYKLYAFTFVEQAGRSGHRYALIAVSLDILSMIGDSAEGAGALGALASNILPERMILSVLVDYTKGVERDEPSYLFNDYSNTGKVIDTLSKLIPSLDIDDISAQIGDTVIEMLDKIYDSIGAEPVTYSESPERTAAIALDDIFTIITDIAFKKNDGTTVIQSGEFKDILRGLYDTDGFETRNNVTEDSSYGGFISDIVVNYYLNPDSEITDFDGLSTFMGDLGNHFDGEKLLVKDDNPDPIKYYLAYDVRDADDLKPIMSGEQIGALIVEKMPSDAQGYTVRDVRTGFNKLIITLEVGIDTVMPAKVKRLLDGVDKLYVVATVDMNETSGGSYNVNASINNMTSGTYKAFVRLAESYDDNFNLDDIMNEFGQVLYDELGALEEDVGEGLVSFTENGMEFPGFYDFLANKMGLDGEYTADNLKESLQGMYARVDVFDNSNNYTDYFYTRNTGEDKLSSDFLASGGEATDIEFNDFFDTIGDMLADGVSGINAVQTIILAENDARDEVDGYDANNTPSNIREWIGARTGTDASTAELLVVTFKITMALSYKGSESSAGFLPDEIYATAVFRRGESGEFENDVALIYNDLTLAQYEMIANLLDIEPDEGTVNINSVCGAAVLQLNDMFGSGDAYFGRNDTGKKGIGKIVYDKS